jgi:hypothetical protein
VKLVGYIADWDIHSVSYDLVDQDAKYMLTQHTLVPLLVKPAQE